MSITISNVLHTLCLTKTEPFYYFNNIIKNQLLSIIVGMPHPEETTNCCCTILESGKSDIQQHSKVILIKQVIFQTFPNNS